MILPTEIKCKGKEFEVNVPYSFHKVTGVYISNASFNSKSKIWTALANINGMLVLVEVGVSIK